MFLEISNPMDYHAALYIRLSKEDESEGPSQSVTNSAEQSPAESVCAAASAVRFRYLHRRGCNNRTKNIKAQKVLKIRRF